MHLKLKYQIKYYNNYKKYKKNNANIYQKIEIINSLTCLIIFTQEFNF